MNDPRVGLLCAEDHAVGRILRHHLNRRGAHVLHADLSAFPEGIQVSVGARGVVADGVVLDALDALWVPAGEYMSPVPAWVPPRDQWTSLRDDFHPTLRHHQETRAFRASVLRLLSERVPLVNPSSAFRASLLQPWLLRSLARQGLPVTPFVSGNDLERIAHFVDRAEQACRARRLLQRAREEQIADFDYLKEHHEDLDRFPWIVRRCFGESLVEAWVVGGRCAGVRDGDRWLAPADVPSVVSSLAVRCAEVAGLAMGVVSMERDEAGQPWLVDVAACSDPGELEPDGCNVLLESLADTLIALGKAGRPLPGPSFLQDRKRAMGPCPRIGISGRVGDAEARAVARAVEARGAAAVPIELPLFPARRALHECEEGGRIAGEELAELDAVFVRQTGFTSPLPDPDRGPVEHDPWEASYEPWTRLPTDEAESFLMKYSLLHILGQRVRVINPPNAQEVHRNKVWQLFHLASQALPVPPTIAGNDRRACERFVQDQGGPDQVVVKPLAGIYKTCLLSEVGLETALDRGPVILQRFIRGDTIRAYLVNGKLIGAGKIVHDGLAVDSSLGQTGVELVNLPDDVVASGWKAAQRLGLAWTGMDFMREDETRRYFILECNASSMFANFSRMTGCDVPGALAEALLDQEIPVRT
jgi:glutathione synthase/RimK-type ligase-like ATP-grasp enzyme